MVMEQQHLIGQETIAPSSVEKAQVRSRIRAISLSFVVGMLLMAMKFYAYRLTNSSAILSDALESIINVVASAFALGSIIFASLPPDENHPYGHGKIEYFSAGFEGALIIFAALGIFKMGWTYIFHPRHIPRLQEGLLLLLGAGIANLVLGLGLIRVGKKTRSLALVADGKHVLTDVYTSAGMLAGLFMVYMTGWYWLDGAIACLVGLNILVSGFSLMRESFSGLMNASEPQMLEDISELLARHRDEVWIDVHQLRAWRSGSLVHVDFHLILPRELTLDEAHREGKKLENLIRSHFEGDAGVLIHLDPCIDPDCPLCRRNMCRLRKEENAEHLIWTRETLTSQGGAGERLRQMNEKIRSSGTIIVPAISQISQEKNMSEPSRTCSEKIGLSPGALMYVGAKKTHKVKVTVIRYSETQFQEETVGNPDSWEPEKLKPLVWIHVSGLHQTEIIEKIGISHGIHPLIVEDVLNTAQRPKLEEYDDCLFMVLKMFYSDASEENILFEQFSLILISDGVISFQEGEEDIFEPVRKRMKNPQSRIRKTGSDYLAYTLMDAVVDHYFRVTEIMEDRIEAVEEYLFTDLSHEVLQNIHELKREILFLHKTVLPVRGFIGSLERIDSPLIRPATHVYIRDLYDHIIQITDTVETFREISTSLMDIYHSGLSNKMNEVMKVLTVIATIFIPLTFIVGVYGMNFRYMPELEWRWGYPFIWLIIILVGVFMLLYFRKKNWF